MIEELLLVTFMHFYALGVAYKVSIAMMDDEARHHADGAIW
jgi:hypothetical protein